MKFGHHEFNASKPSLSLDIHRNSPTIILDFNRTIGGEGDDYLVAISGERFIDCVIDDLPETVHEAARVGGADIHSRALTDGIEPFEDGQVFRRVLPGIPAATFFRALAGFCRAFRGRGAHDAQGYWAHLLFIGI